MRVFICGIDGYLGWSLACHLASHHHQVGGLDSGRRAQWVEDQGSQSAIPTQPIPVRMEALNATYGMPVDFFPCDMRDKHRLAQAIQQFQPEAIVHLAEMPSAPWSMKFPSQTYDNNVTGSINLLDAIRQIDPNIHLLKLGTMGEYGTPGVPIPEGVFPEGATWAVDDGTGLAENGDLSGLQFPRDPGSFYHAAKVAETVATKLACDKWGLRSTDVMQGVVYGTWIEAMQDDPRLATRFDFDECFGTAINRFCAQAVIGAPITPYGKGEQKRGFLPLADSMQCMELLLENDPPAGEYRVVNQFDSVYSVNYLAKLVQRLAAERGSTSEVVNIANPRKENEDHAYDVATDKLRALGYEPHGDIEGVIGRALDDLINHAGRIDQCSDAITPRITWAA